jgi:Flp pilus assembly protein TadG
MRRFARQISKRFRRDERGVFLVWFALMLTVMLAFAGFAVDFWRWSHEGAKEQKAADAAALAGAVYMLDNPSLAYSNATTVLTNNGYTNGQKNTVVTMTQGSKSNQLKVKVSRTVKNYFGSLVGQGNTTITKTSIAEYIQSIAMGSPINRLGNDPDSYTGSPTDNYPFYWLQFSGHEHSKVWGDAVLGSGCGIDPITPASATPDNCSGGTNSDYDNRGYFYEIEVKAGASGPLTVQAFDPAYVQVGTQCGDDSGNDNLLQASQLTTAQISHWPGGSATPAQRYNPAATSQYCTGDFAIDPTDPATWTTYTLRAPDNTAWDATDNPVVSGCQIEIPGYYGDIQAKLQNSTLFFTRPDGTQEWFAEVFRQWYTLCTVSSPTVGSYFLQIESGKANGTSDNGDGSNHFALRAGLGGSYTTALAAVHGDSKMGVYANVANVTANFYLARVLPSLKGRSLVLDLFDVGDSSGTGTIQLVPSADMTNNGVGMASFPGCTYTAPPGNATGPPWGTFIATTSLCQVTPVTRTTYNGQWIQVKVPIPANYSCNTASTTGCWMKIRYTFTSSVNDNTTWSARVDGTPVRIIQ